MTVVRGNRLKKNEKPIRVIFEGDAFIKSDKDGTFYIEVVKRMIDSQNWGVMEIPEDFFEYHCYGCCEKIEDKSIAVFSQKLKYWICKKCYDRIVVEGEYNTEDEEIMKNEFEGKVREE